MLVLDRAKAIGGEGSLTEADLRDFNVAERQILEYMKVREWITEDQLIELTGQRQAGRRMRALRGPRWIIAKKKIDKRTWVYKLVAREVAQGDLFKGE